MTAQAKAFAPQGAPPGALHPAPIAEPEPAGAPIKVYCGARGSGTYVFVCEGPLRMALRDYGLTMRPAFEWGYRGSAPLALARCILIEHFGDRALCRHCEGGWVQTEGAREQCSRCGGLAYRLPVSCAAFMEEMIATLPRGRRETWKITEAEIEEWVRSAPRLD